jgi:hypothetical protein
MVINIFKKIFKRESIKRNMLDKKQEDVTMGKLVIKDGKLVDGSNAGLQPIPQEILDQMRKETEMNKQRMEATRVQPQPQEEEEMMLPEDIPEEELDPEATQPLTGRQQYENEMYEQEQPAQVEQQDFNVIVNIVMLGGLPMRINVPGKYVEDFIMKFNNAIDRQIHFNIGTQVLVTKNILYYSLE